ncbi:MAG: disulfide bond formation protein B [Panacagrimonas sp.]
MRLNYLILNLAGFAACVFGLAFALYLQHFKGYEPCPLCIFQRVALLATGLLFLLAAVHRPRDTGRWIYAGLVDVAATVGAIIAGRHVWLQSLPPDQVPACGPSLDYLMDLMPLMEVVQLVLRGDGNCAKIDAAWLGLSLPAWTLVTFVGLSVFAILIPVFARRLEMPAQ